MEKFQRGGDVGHRFKRQPDEAGDEVDELEGGFPFPQIVGSQNLTCLDGDLAETGDEEFPADDEGGNPDGADAFGGEKYEGRANEDLVGEGIEQFAEGGDKVHFPSQPAIDVIAGGGDQEQDQGGHMTPSAFPSHENNESGCQDKTREGDRVRKVHM